MQASAPIQKVTLGQSFNNLIYPGIQDIRGIGGFFVRLIAVWVLGLELVLNDGRGARATPLSMILLAIPFHIVLVICSIVFESGYTFWGDIEWGYRRGSLCHDATHACQWPFQAISWLGASPQWSRTSRSHLLPW